MNEMAYLVNIYRLPFAIIWNYTQMDWFIIPFWCAKLSSLDKLNSFMRVYIISPASPNELASWSNHIRSLDVPYRLAFEFHFFVARCRYVSRKFLIWSRHWKNFDGVTDLELHFKLTSTQLQESVWFLLICR